MIPKRSNQCKITIKNNIIADTNQGTSFKLRGLKSLKHYKYNKEDEDT